MNKNMGLDKRALEHYIPAQECDVIKVEKFLRSLEGIFDETQDRVIFSILLYGFMKSKRSLSELLNAIGEDVDFLYLTKGYKLTSRGIQQFILEQKEKILLSVKNYYHSDAQSEDMTDFKEYLDALSELSQECKSNEIQIIQQQQQ